VTCRGGCAATLRDRLTICGATHSLHGETSPLTAAQIADLGFRPYGQAFDFSDTIPGILAAYGGKPAEAPATLDPRVEHQGLGRLGERGPQRVEERRDSAAKLRQEGVDKQEFFLYGAREKLSERLAERNARTQPPRPRDTQKSQELLD